LSASSTFCGLLTSQARKAISIDESTTMRPTPTAAASRSSSTVLALPCMMIRAESKPAASAIASSPPELTSSPAPSSATQRAMSVVSSDFAAYTISTSRSVVR
jgi:hypothetical protein